MCCNKHDIMNVSVDKTLNTYTRISVVGNHYTSIHDVNIFQITNV